MIQTNVTRVPCSVLRENHGNARLQIFMQEVAGVLPTQTNVTRVPCPVLRENHAHASPQNLVREVASTLPFNSARRGSRITKQISSVMNHESRITGHGSRITSNRESRITPP
jgi:hypothetical protein